jgi:hypothetical protein
MLLELVCSTSSTRIRGVVEDTRWKPLASAVELCVPAEKQEELTELPKPDSVAGFLQGFSQVVGQLAGNTFTLVAGFVLHALL